CVGVFAVPSVLLQNMVWDVRLYLLFSGLVGVVAALLFSSLTARHLSRTLNRLVAHARLMRQGQALPTQDEQGTSHPVFSGSLADMATELDTTLSVLGQERERIAAILDAMQDGVLAVNSQEEVQIINRAALALLRADTLRIGQPLFESLRLPH